MQTLVELLKESVLTQAIITTLVIGIYGYCVIAGIVVPMELKDLLILVISFYFGSKLGVAQGQLKRAIEDK